MLIHFVVLSLGLIGLWFGADRVVDSGKAIASRFGVSPLFIGLTIVSIGTSLPEIMVSIFSGARGNSDLAISAMIGSCLTQITLILGIAGMIHNIKVRPKAIKIDGGMLLLAISIFYFLFWTDHRLTVWESVLMILIYAAYLIFTYRHDELSAEAHERGLHDSNGHGVLRRFFEMAFGIGILIYSGDVVLDKATLIAHANDFSEAFIGLMIIGVATCLPELSTALVAAYKRTPGLSIGPLIGSNITDPLLSIGLGGIVGGGLQSNSDLLNFAVPFWFLSSLIALLIIHRGELTLNRSEGALLIVIYGLFVATQLI